MSQDLFDDEDYAVDDPGEVEFSGVSCSGTSSSPGSQQSQKKSLQPAAASPPPPPPPPLPQPLPLATVSAVAGAGKVFICPVCNKELKTLRGYKGHVARHPEPHTPPAPTAPQTSTASTATSSTTAAPPVASTSSSAAEFICRVCKHGLKTKSGWIRHEAAHKLKDALKRMPDPIQFREQRLQTLVKEIIQEISEEPSYGDGTKSAFLTECQASEKWTDFVTILNQSISAFVFEKQTKFLPTNQYEEMQKKMNAYLNLNIDSLKVALLSCGSVEISSALAGRLVFRIAMKLFQGAYVWVLQMMKTSQTEIQLNLQAEMSEAEENALLIEIGGFIRAYFEKGLKHSSEQRRRQSECIKQVFVDGQQPISRSQFLRKCNWYSGEEECIVLSSHASSFFKIIELEIMPSTIDTSSSEEVIENVMLHRALLEHWYYLSNTYFSEDLSLLFLRDLVISYVKFSAQFEEKRLNRLEERSVRASTAPLRVHLQRNFVEKDDGTEEIVT